MILRAGGKSKAKAVAGALAQALRREGTAEIHAIGPAAVNQAMKAIAIARGHVAPAGKDVLCVPAFLTVQLNGAEKTGLRIIVITRDAHLS